MDDMERLALAAIVHDLSGLFAGRSVPAAALRVLGLAALDTRDQIAFLKRAETYALAARQATLVPVHGSLRSVFGQIDLVPQRQAGELTPSQDLFYRFAALPAAFQFDETFAPLANPNPDDRHTLLDALLRDLERIGQQINRNDVGRLTTHLLASLQRYTTRLPVHYDDLAFYDHARLTSAIALCLYRYHAAQPTEAALLAGEDAERFCLLVGDLSGIQTYIFDIASIGPGGVARRLRARSFYLSTLADLLGRQVAWRLGLPDTNLLMASGGKFYVLAPNTADLAANIAQLRYEIDSWLLEQFNGEIGVHLAGLPFSGAAFRASSPDQPGFGSLIGRLGQLLNREKRRRSHSILSNAGIWSDDAFVLRQRDFAGRSECVSCHKFPAEIEATLCQQCQRDLVLGAQLPRVRYLAYYAPGATGAEQATLPMPLGWSARVLASADLTTVGNPALVLKLNDPQIDELIAHPASFRYLANYVPTNRDGAGLSFEEIAKANPEAPQGRELLGYLKADVDYLGMLFAEGLRRDGSSFDTAPQIAALSRELDLFFSAGIQRLLSQTAAFQRVYTIFSGGDDLFLVGPWDQAVQLAFAIRQGLQRSTGMHPDITLSAGVLFTRPRYPIARAAGDAEDALELAKERTWTDGHGRQRTRDQISILGDTLHWDAANTIFAELEQLRLTSANLTSALLYDLIQFGEAYRRWQASKSNPADQTTALRYKAHFAYTIARNLRRGDPVLYGWADQLIRSLHGDAQPSLTIQHLGLIATYLLYARRERRSTTNDE